MASNFIDSSLQVSLDAERDNFFNRHGVASFRSICTTLYYICSKCQRATTAFGVSLWGQPLGSAGKSTGGGWHTDTDKEWIPAYAESTPQNAPCIEKKCSGVLKRNTRGNDGSKRLQAWALRIQ